MHRSLFLVRQCIFIGTLNSYFVISCNESGGMGDEDKWPSSRNVGLPGVNSASNRNKYSGVCYNEVLQRTNATTNILYQNQDATTNE